MAEFQIGLQYISMQDTGAENEFLLRKFDRCAAKTRIFSYVKVGGPKMEIMPTPRFGPNGASAWMRWLSTLTFSLMVFTSVRQVKRNAFRKSLNATSYRSLKSRNFNAPCHGLVYCLTRNAMAYCLYQSLVTIN